MKSRDNKRIREMLLACGLTEQTISKLYHLFDNLRDKISIGKASTADVELLVQGIHDLTVNVSNDLFDLLTKGIRQVSKNYTDLFPLLLNTFKQARQDQAKYIDKDEFKEEVQNSKRFTTYLKRALIQPMLFELAKQNDNAYTSKYFGKIPTVTMGEDNNLHAREIFLDMDPYLDELMQLTEEHGGEVSALKPYALIYRHLNKENAPEPTPISNKTFLNYLEDTASNKQQLNAKKISSRVMLVDREIIHLYSSNNSDNTHLYGTTLIDKQVILLAVDKNINLDQILKALVHEIQHLYNSLFLSDTNQANTSNDLTDDAINQFIKITDTLTLSKYAQYILKDIQIILKSIKFYEQRDRDIDELSAHFTSLLFDHTQYHIREVINKVLTDFADMPKDDQFKKALLVGKALSNAFTLIEATLNHFSLALANFTLDKTIETLENNANNHHRFKESLPEVKELKAIPLTMQSWDSCIAGTLEIESIFNLIVKMVSYQDPKYALHDLAKTGNTAAIQKLIQINKENIDIPDRVGNTAIMYSIAYNHLGIFELLLNSGASLNWLITNNNIKDNSALHIAADYGSFAFIPILLKHGISAEKLNAKKQSALLLCAKLIAGGDKDNIEKAEYDASITALAHLLSHTREQRFNSSNQSGVHFYQALIRFRKSIGILYTLHNSGALRFSGGLPIEIIHNIALQLDEATPNKFYERCYRDIMQVVLSDNHLLSKFITLGIQTAYNEFCISIQNNMNPIDAIKRSIFDIIPNVFVSHDYVNASSLTDEERKQLTHSYSPRELSTGVVSLAALTLAQKQLQTISTSSLFNTQEDRYKERRLAIKEWKSKIGKKEDDGLSIVILQACKDMGITEIDTFTYHKLASILKKLVIKDKKTPSNYSPTMFTNEIKQLYQEPLPSNEIKLQN